MLAGGIAHDFNNLLTVIIGRCQMLLRRRRPEEPEYEDLDLVEGTARRAANLTRQLLAFSRRQVVQPWHFGDPAFKATGFELIGLPDLVPTNKLTPPKPGTPADAAALIDNATFDAAAADDLARCTATAQAMLTSLPSMSS